MTALSRLLSLLRTIVWRSRMEREMDAELQFHLDARTEDLVTSGLSPAEARRRAHEEFGDPLRWKEAGREVRGVGWIDGIKADLRYGLRIAVKSPGFAAAAVLSMAIGIGANTAIFSLVNSVLLKPLPVRDPEALVLLAVSSDDSGLGSSFPYPFYRDLRQANEALSGVLASASMAPSLETDGPAEQVDGELVSGNYFEVLGVQPHLGRLFTDLDERAEVNRVVVLSYGYWQRRFGGDPSVIGRSIRLNRLPMTVIGITPASFHGIEPGALPSVRVPITLQAAMHGGGSRLESSGEWWLQIMGRLRPGVSRAQAADALDRRYSAFRAQFPWQESSPERLDVLDGSGGRPTIRRRFSLALVILTVLVAIVLALVCVNVGNLMLARSTARQREMSLRLALGAGRLRMVRQLLVEVSLLAAAGGALGLLLSGWSVGVLARLADAPPEVQIPTDFRVLAFATLVTFLTGVLSGLTPALSSAKVDLVGALKIGTLQIAGSRTAAGSFLVAGQVALSLALLIGAGLFARTLFNLRHAGFGFQTERLALVTMNPILAGYSKERVRVFFADVLERVTALPTVDSAAFGVMPLLDGNMWGSGLVIDNGQRDDRPGPTRNAVGPGFFRTTGLPLKEGREFTATDSASSEPVAIVNEAFVRRYLGDGSALGRRIGPGGSRGPARHTIVGVTRDSKITHVRDATIAFWYIPYAQLTNLGQLTLHVRATESPEAALRDVMAAIASTDPGVPLFQAGTMRQQIENQVQVERLLATLAAVFALLAVALASLGLYGVVSYTTSARTREFGIRMALGASRRAILRLVFGQCVPLIAAGAVAGVAIASVGARQLQPLLYDLRPFDAPTLLAAVAIVAGVTTVAAMLPARRAARINPAATLQ
jgi:predicted permease